MSVLNKQEVTAAVAGFDAGQSYAQSIGGNPSNYSAAMLGVSVYGAPQADVQTAASTAKNTQRFDYNG